MEITFANWEWSWLALFVDIYIFFYKQLDFRSEPGVGYVSWKNEAESCLKIA